MAANCSTGETLASTEAQASDKSHVLDALGKAASAIRSKLGESLGSVQKFNTPLEQATTPSLEALQAYSLGRSMMNKDDNSDPIPYFRQAIELDPNFAIAYATLGFRYSGTNSTMLLATEASTAAYSGLLGKAREFSRRAIASGERAAEKETAAGYEAGAALWERLFGNAAEAHRRAAAALALSNVRDVQIKAALAFAGDTARAQSLADDLNKRFPEDIRVQFIYLPTLQAQLALNRNDSSKAIDVLQAALPYELVTEASLHPAYVRGEAYLAGHQGNEAVAEFQKIIDHRGIVRNEPIGALAHLGLARAYTLQGDTTKAREVTRTFTLVSRLRLQ